MFIPSPTYRDPSDPEPEREPRSGLIPKNLAAVICVLILATLGFIFVSQMRSGDLPAHGGRAEELCLQEGKEQGYKEVLYPRASRGMLGGAYTSCLVVEKDGTIRNIWEGGRMSGRNSR